MAVRDHHVRDLIQRLPRHFDAVHLQHLIVNRQQPGALCQASRDHPGYEDAENFLQTMGSHSNTGPVADIEAQGFVRAVAVESDAAVGLGQDVHVDDGGDGTEVLWHADWDAGTLTVDVAVAKRHHCLLFTSQGVGAKGGVVDLLCKQTEKKRPEKLETNKNKSSR